METCLDLGNLVLEARASKGVVCKRDPKKKVVCSGGYPKLGNLVLKATSFKVVVYKRGPQKKMICSGDVPRTRKSCPGGQSLQST